jgi:signal transduction histidine kinase
VRSRLLGTGAAVAVALVCAAALVLAAWVHARAAWVPYEGGVYGVTNAAIGALLVHLRPRNSIGWLLVLTGLLQGLSVGLGAYGAYGVDVAERAWPLAPWSAQLSSVLWFPSVLVPATVLVAVYPSGRPVARWWRWPIGAVAAGLTVLTLVGTFSQEAYDDIASGPAPLVIPEGWWTVAAAAVSVAAIVLGGLAIWVGTVVRLVRARPPERQQLAWLVCVVVPLLIGVFLVPTPPAGILVAALLVPGSVAVGVVRYRLLGIVISRGLVYAALTAAVVVGFLTVAAVAGAVLDRAIAPVPGAVVAALLAVTLSPARVRLQAAADRFVYGERPDPVAAVTRLGDRVAEADESELLPAVLATVTTALRAPGAYVTAPDGRLLGATDPATADVGTSGTATEPVALRMAGRDVGTLHVVRGSAGERFTADDERLLSALAPQVAVVVRALELTGFLEQERTRVLVATHAERDRIRRDLHDGLGPSLAGISLGVQAVQAAGPGSPVAPGLLDRLREEVDAAVGEVRRIIDGLRPATLDDLGLLAAIRRHAETVSASVPVRVEAGDLPPLEPDVETTAFRIAQEALTNVARHSGARSARVELRVAGGHLEVAVADDGAGFAPSDGDGARPAGVGLVSMRQRAEAVGGRLAVDSGGSGTRVVAALPLGVN